MNNHRAGKEPMFWKDPIRYLKNRSWEDEPVRNDRKVFGNATVDQLQQQEEFFKNLDNAQQGRTEIG
jgi:hypothetical protein